MGTKNTAGMAQIFLSVYMAPLCALFWLQSLASAFAMEINVKMNEVFFLKTLSSFQYLVWVLL